MLKLARATRSFRYPIWLHQTRLLRQVLNDSGAFEPPASFAAQIDLARVADEEKVLLTLAPWFERAPELAPEVADRLALRRARATLLRNEEKRIRSAFVEAGIPHVFLKGSAFERLEPGRLRQMSDLDLILPDEHAAWLAVDMLLRWEYGIAAMSVAIDEQRSRHWTGTVVLESRSGSLVEINFGDFHPHWYTRLWLSPDFWSEGLTGPDPCLTPRWAAAIFLAELVDRRHLSLRDQRDAESLFRTLTTADKEWLNDFARKRGLVGEAALLSKDIQYLRSPLAGLYRTARRLTPVLTRAVGHQFAANRRVYGASAAARAAMAGALRDVLRRRMECGTSGRLVRAIVRRANASTGVLTTDLAGLMTLIPLERRPPVYEIGGSASCSRLELKRVDRWQIVRSPAGPSLAVIVPVVSEDEYDRVVSAVRSEVAP